jgi:hypothetical protein
LEKAIKTMFERDEQLRKADLSVRADITKNELTLSGTVESEAVRSRAVELAKTAHVGVVVNASGPIEFTLATRQTSS